MSDERAFRGVWIPASIWLNTSLTLQEKVMLVEIDSLQHPEKGCFKSNAKLAEFFQLSRNRVSEIISSLTKKGWIKVDQVREGKQVVERRIFMLEPLDKSNLGGRDTEQGCSENRENPSRDSERGCSENEENPSRDPEGGCSENREERGSGVRGSGLGVQGEGVVSPGASPAADGEYLAADQTGSTSDGEESADDLLARVPVDMPGTRDPHAKTFKPWANYCVAYRKRYGTWPVWNQKTAAQLSQLVDRLGKALAPKAAAYYLKLNSQFYTTRCHPVALLLADCESIATQLQTGQQTTATRARQLDSTQSNLSNAEEAKRLAAAKREGRACH